MTAGDDTDGRFTVYRTRPDRDAAPNRCQSVGCKKYPTKIVKYSNPKEYVCFCPEHAAEQIINADRAQHDLKIK